MFRSYMVTISKLITGYTGEQLSKLIKKTVKRIEIRCYIYE